MKENTIKFFSILIALMIIFCVIIFFYRVEVNSFVAGYTKKITTCGNIFDENGCWAKDFCEGIYKPACDNCSKLEFVRCQSVSDQNLKQRQMEQKVCERSGGKWYRNQLGNFCFCEKAGLNKVFNRQKGCVDKF